MQRNNGISKIIVVVIVLLTLFTAGGVIFLVSRTKPSNQPTITSREAVTVNSISSGDPAVGATITSQINGLTIKQGSINTDLLGKMIRSFNLNLPTSMWHDFGSDLDAPVKTISFSFLPIENASTLQPGQRAETTTGPDGDIRIISSTYDRSKIELDFQIYYKKSFLDTLTPDSVSSEWTSSIFRAISLSASSDSFKKDSASFAKMFTAVVGREKLLEVTK